MAADLEARLPTRWCSYNNSWLLSLMRCGQEIRRLNRFMQLSARVKSVQPNNFSGGQWVCCGKAPVLLRTENDVADIRGWPNGVQN